MEKRFGDRAGSYDLTVLGEAEPSMRAVLFGTVPERIVTSTNVPVIVVRHEEEEVNPAGHTLQAGSPGRRSASHNRNSGRLFGLREGQNTIGPPEMAPRRLNRPNPPKFLVANPDGINLN